MSKNQIFESKIFLSIIQTKNGKGLIYLRNVTLIDNGNPQIH
jgi:hypothetical protein